MGIKKAAIYTRVSTTEQHPEMQTRELVNYVKLRGWNLYKEYCDQGIWRHRAPSSARCPVGGLSSQEDRHRGGLEVRQIRAVTQATAERLGVAGELSKHRVRVMHWKR